MTDKPSVDIVLPCYNPSPDWTTELLGFYEKAKQLYQVHFIVVNDGSTSQVNIQEHIRKLQELAIPVSLVSYSKNRGKGYALRRGVQEASHAFVVYTDIDFPFTDQSTLQLIHTLCTTNNDVVIGYRPASYYGQAMSGWRRLLSRSFRFFIRVFLRMKVTDTQCGLKGFNQRGKRMFLNTTVNRYLFDFEFVYACSRDASIRLSTVEVKLKDDVVFSKMRLRVLLQELFNLSRVLLFRRSRPE